ELAEHVDVLRALPRVQERGFGSRAVADEHAARAQHLAQLWGTAGKRLDGLARLVSQFSGLAVVDGDPYLGCCQGRRWRSRGWRLAGRRLAPYPGELGSHVGFAVAADH